MSPFTPLLSPQWSVAPAICGSGVALTTTSLDTLGFSAMLPSLFAEPLGHVSQALLAMVAIWVSDSFTGIAVGISSWSLLLRQGIPAFPDAAYRRPSY